MEKWEGGEGEKAGEVDAELNKVCDGKMIPHCVAQGESGGKNGISSPRSKLSSLSSRGISIRMRRNLANPLTLTRLEPLYSLALNAVS